MNGMEEHPRDTLPLTEQAAHWWVALNDAPASPADKQTFGGWVVRSPERIAAYLRMVRLMRALQSPQARWPDDPAADLIRAARHTSGVSALTSPRGSAPRRPLSRNPWTWTLAASLALALALGWLQLSPDRYHTALGEQRSVMLEDGSLVTLNTSSRIHVHITRQHRTIRLIAGEALFQVAQDKQRPFEVHAGHTTIRAIGTQFNVDRRDTRTTVTVLEGRVMVGTAEQTPVSYLDAAERIIVTPTGASPPEPVANVTPVTAWTQRRMIFERRPLSEVAEEFNRYNRQQLVIEDPDLGRQQVTGVFQANDPASFMAFLDQIPGVKVRQDETGTHHVLRAQ